MSDLALAPRANHNSVVHDMSGSFRPCLLSLIHTLRRATSHSDPKHGRAKRLLSAITCRRASVRHDRRKRWPPPIALMCSCPTAGSSTTMLIGLPVHSTKSDADIVHRGVTTSSPRLPACLSAYLGPSCVNISQSPCIPSPVVHCSLLRRPSREIAVDTALSYALLERPISF